MIAALRLAAAAWLLLAAQPAAALDPPGDPHYRATGSWKQPYPDQWGMHRIGLTADARSAWHRLPAGAAPVIVAMIDTGLDWNHLDIAWENLWKNPGEIPDNGRDDDGNGFVDDLIGWNFYENSNKPWDHDGHGTFTAGIVAATWNNGAGIAGINPMARIMVLKALNSFGNSRASFLARAIVYAADNGARVINLSVGGKELSAMEIAAVRHAVSKNCVVVVAAGNDGVSVDDFGMAGMPEVITVGAAGPDDKRAAFSNYGKAVDLLAPGVDILSLRARRTDTLLDIPGGQYGAGAAFVGGDNRYYRAAGTSFAAPFVTGVASLLISANPSLTAAQVRRMLTSTARDVGAPGVDQFSGYGMVDAAAALAADPTRFVEAAIHGVELATTARGPGVRVLGSVGADRLAEAFVEIGRGESPTQWTRVLAGLAPTENGELGVIGADAFRGAPVWTLRLTVVGAGGMQREARFRLSLE